MKWEQFEFHPKTEYWVLENLFSVAPLVRYTIFENTYDLDRKAGNKTFTLILLMDRNDYAIIDRVLTKKNWQRLGS